MNGIKLTYVQKVLKEDRSNYDTLAIKDFQKFNPSVLGLGDIEKEGSYKQALSAIFDLEGFTDFCNQIDPHLVIPDFLNSFLLWLFNKIANEFTRHKDKTQVYMWCRLPFFSKFMGDGVLFLWDTTEIEQVELGNVVFSLHNICDLYRSEFLPKIKRQVSKAPKKLRCGIARGQVISVGDNKDFVGACINVSARLQKLGQFSFAFSKRGFTLEKCFDPNVADNYELIKTQIRGIGDGELVYVCKTELDALSPIERKQFKP